MSSPVPPICPPPRISRACENCRARRTRCLPSTKAGVCQRCMNGRMRCTFSSPNQEPRRPNARKSLKQPLVEQVKAVNTEATATNPTEGNILTGLFASRPDDEGDKGQHGVGVLQNIHRQVFGRWFPQAVGLTSNGESSTNSTTPDLTAIPADATQVVTKPGIDSQEAEKYLRRFEELSAYFPFVLLPENWTLRVMLRSHPFLLLGIIAGMSANDIQKQKSLDAEFRRVLSEKVVVNAEKSLDLLQGLLVYLAWYPMQLGPKTHQVFQFIQLAVTMVIDLNYNHVPEPDTIHKPEDPLMQRRAYLGCYYISSAISIPPKRPNTLPFIPYTQICLDDISANPTHKTDELLVSYIVLQRISEEALLSTLKYRDHGPNSNAPYLDVPNYSSKFQLQAAERTFSPDHFTYPPFSLLHRLTTMYVGSITSLVDSSGLQPAQHPLSQCFQDTRSVFEGFIALPIAEYRNFSMVEWSRLTQTVINLFTLCSSLSDVPHLDPGVRHQSALFGIYFESLCYRMDELTQVGKTTKPPPDVFCMFKSVLRIVREMYEDIIQGMPQGSSPSSENTLAASPATICPMLNGKIRRTEYWDVLNTSNVDNATYENQGFDVISQLEDWTAWESGLMDDGDQSFNSIPH